MSAQGVTLLTLVIGISIGILIGILISRLRNQGSGASSAMAQGEIASLTKQLEELRKRENETVRFDEALNDVKARMATLTTQTHDAEVKRAASDSAIKTQIESMRTGNESLVNIATKLEGALSNSQSRGKYGEAHLEMILESAGMIEDVHYQRQESSRSQGGDGLRPDITISIPGGSRIFIDSKFPFQRFLEAIDEKEEEKRASLMALHAKDLLKHVDDLYKKEYQGVSDSPDFVVLFAPFESILSEALRADPQFLNKTFDKNVTIATPTTMLALLRTVFYSFGRHDLAKNAVEIQGVATEFLKRVGILHTKLTTLGDRIKSAERAYNDVLATAESNVLVPARKMKGLGVSSGNNTLAPIANIDDEVRAIKGANLEIDYIDAEEIEEDEKQ